MTSKCGNKKKSGTRGAAEYVTDVVLYNKEFKKSLNDDVIYTSVLQEIISENQSECVHN